MSGDEAEAMAFLARLRTACSIACGDKFEGELIHFTTELGQWFNYHPNHTSTRVKGNTHSELLINCQAYHESKQDRAAAIKKEIEELQTELEGVEAGQ